MASLDLTEGDDIHLAGNGDDQIHGLGGRDLINGGNGADTVDGGAGQDVLDGGRGDDELRGGEGDDRLSGGSGADVFQYTFTVQPAPVESFTGWLIARGFGSAVIDGELADGTPQNFFAVHYSAWLDELIATHGLGADTDGDGLVSAGLNQNDPLGTPWIEGLSGEELAALFGNRDSVILKTGSTSQERFYSDTFSLGQTLISSLDGHDTITDFKPGTDRLEFSGLDSLGITAANFGDYFALAVLDADADGAADDSRLTLAGSNDWSLTLLNVNTELAGLYAAIDFG